MEIFTKIVNDFQLFLKILPSEMFDEVLNKSLFAKLYLHCVKSVRIRSYSGPHFPELGLNTERFRVSEYEHFLRSVSFFKGLSTSAEHLFGKIHLDGCFSGQKNFENIRLLLKDGFDEFFILKVDTVKPTTSW